MAVTIQQIAEKAGVSRGTVDRALNNRGRINPEVAEMVKRTAEEMGYVHKARKRQKNAGGKKKIGIVTQLSGSSFMLEINRGIQTGKKELEELGVEVIVKENASVREEDQLRAIDELVKEGIQGLALMPVDTEGVREKLNWLVNAVDNEGDEMTFAIAQEPKKGSVALTEDGLGFVYTPGGKLGSDSFTYTASDACGNTSLPATVSVTIEKASSGVCYADMGGNRAHTAAVDLAEHGVFVGARIGDSYFFEPERTLSRGEFVAMALAAMDVSAEDVQMTGFCDDAGIPTWAKGYAVSALNAGVVSGVSMAEGVAFRANDAISLNEAAVVLNRLLRVTDVDLSDYDAQDAENAWCAQAAEMLSAAMTLKDGRAEKGGLLSGIFG